MNQQLYKICPECGQPGELQAQLCARCGHAYRTQFTPAGQPVTPPGATDGRTQMGQPWTQPQTFPIVAGVVGGVIALVAFVVLLVIIGLMAEDQSAGPASGAANSSPVLTSSGLFRERPSQVEIPTIRISTDYAGGASLILTGRDGSRYTATCYPRRDAVFQVPAGDYGVELLSPDASVTPRTGLAVFRRYKEYEAGFTVEPHIPWEELPPLRLGDIE